MAADVAAALQPLLAALPDTGALDTIKQSTVRTVLRGTVGGIDVHLKLFRAVTLSDHARDRLRGDRGSREARNLIAAAALGLPAVTPLACGVCAADGGSRSFLITRTVPGAVPFAFDLPAAARAAAGRLLRQAHDRGFLPGDLHPDNVVVDAAGRPWLLDLSSVRHRGDAEPRRRAAGLAFFCQALDGGPLDAAARPLLDAYLEAGAELPEGFRALLARAARRVRQRALAAFGRRALRPCRHTLVERGARRVRWYWHRPAGADDPARLHAGLPESQTACRAFLQEPPPPLRSGRRGAVWLLPGLAVKRREQGAARHLFTAMYWLEFARVPQPGPVALATFDGTGHVFARRLPGPDVAARLQQGSLRGPGLLAAASSFGDSVGRLHAHGLRNRDLKFENLVPDPATGRICMADLDGVRRKRPADVRGQGADLGRLLAAWRAAGAPGAGAVAFAFLRAYLRARERLLQPAPARRLLRAAARRARQWQSAHR